MAVLNAYQGKGIGRALVMALENRILNEKSIVEKEITLHARDNATKFYEKLGYKCFLEPFEEVGIRHRHMKKNLGLSNVAKMAS